jgi:hypothetical protein
MSSFYYQRKITKQGKALMDTSIQNALNNNFNTASCICKANDKNYTDSTFLFNQQETQVQREVNAIRYSIGGNTQFGNYSTNQIIQLREMNLSPFIYFNGSFEGQPGGMRRPPRNKF